VKRHLLYISWVILAEYDSTNQGPLETYLLYRGLCISDGVGTAASGITPDSEKADKEVSGELDRHHLRDHVQVGHERILENDGNVGCVEQFDWKGAVLSPVSGRLDG